MKGLEKIPATKNLADAYDTLLGDKVGTGSGIPELKIALWTQWSRFDPRLAEILVEFISRRWEAIPPLPLRKALLDSPWPSAFGVIFENTLSAGLIPPGQRRVFRHWGAVVLSGVAPASNEQFFFGIRKVGGSEMMKDVVESSKSYLKWGYFGRELLLNKAAPSESRTELPATARERFLRELISGRNRITVNDYREALDHRVSRRQAELDLARSKDLIPVGNTRGRFYRVR